MAYNIRYKSSVKRDLRRLDKSAARRLLDQIETDLARNPTKYPVMKGPFAGLRRMRLGDDRVIYVILGDDVLVLRNGHRKDVYS